MDYEAKTWDYYGNFRKEMLTYLPEHPRKVLDVGCGRGSFAQLVKEKMECEVWGVEYKREEAIEAEKVLDKVLSGSIEENLKYLPNDYFDVVYFNDVLEHLIDPYQILFEFKKKLSSGGITISSIPNIRYHNALTSILFKKEFRYKNSGVMDQTHLRFFTSKSIKRMYEEQGYQVLLHEGINKSRSLKPILYNIPLLFTHLDIFYPQFATVAKIKKE